MRDAKVCSMARDGICLAQGSLSRRLIADVHDDLRRVAALLGTPSVHLGSIDSAWNWLCENDRASAGLMYNAFKRLPSVYRLCCSAEVTTAIARHAGFSCPLLVDVNCRIDSYSGEKFLFDWHQDYWFSVCSPNAAVVWIPMTDVDEDTGGLDAISNEYTGGKIYRSKAGSKYDSYADAVVLDEDIPLKHAFRATACATDLLIFRFSVLHRSAKVISRTRSRFTIQLRFADGADDEFRKCEFKPGVVSKAMTDYLFKN